MKEEDLRKIVTWEAFPKYQTGGQSCGVIHTGVTLICEDAGFQVTVNNYRSQVKNRELAWTLFMLYCSEVGIF